MTVVKAGMDAIPLSRVPATPRLGCIFLISEVYMSSSKVPAGLLSLAEAAEYYGVSQKSVRRWIAAGRLEAVRVGPRLLRVRRELLDQATRRLVTA